MLKMSFYDGTLDRKKAAEFISKTDKKLVYTIGYEYKSPTTHRKPITKEYALKLVEKESYLDIKEEKDCVHLNSFTSNDMY